MKTLYLDCFSGISGNMFMGMLFDLGLSIEAWEAEMKRLAYPKGLTWEITPRLVEGIQGTFFEVHLPQQTPRDRQWLADQIRQRTRAGATHANQGPQGTQGTQSPQGSQGAQSAFKLQSALAFKAQAGLKGQKGALSHSAAHPGFAQSSPGHPAGQPHGGHPAHAHRHYGEIIQTLSDAALHPAVFERARLTFELLARAEGRVHGRPWQSVGFHEVGNWDSQIDILGVCVGLHLLNIEAVYCSPLTEGQGFIECAHGQMPIPVPAVVNLLRETDFVLKQTDISTELVTPTGMALVKALAKPAATCPLGRVLSVGYGFGSRQTGRLNALRGFLIETVDEGMQGERKGVPDEVEEISFYVDDADPETLAHLRKTLADHVLDHIVWSAQGKKERLGQRHEVLIEPHQHDRVVSLIFAESGTVGLRYRRLQRETMKRSEQVFCVEQVRLRYKCFQYGDVQKGTWEYEDLQTLANQASISLREAREMAERVRLLDHETGREADAV